MTDPSMTTPAVRAEEALTKLQDLLLDTDRLQVFLDDLVRLTADTLPVETVHCSITLRSDGRYTTAAASDALVLAFDQQQYAVDEGPCLQTLRTGRPHHIDDIRAEDRFGSFTERAAEHGVRSMFALPLVPPGNETTGVMNLYARNVAAFTPAVRDQAAVFAGYAAGALGIALKIDAQVEFSEDLQAALDSRSVIDQALGIIMGQQRCTAGRAFEILTRTSQNRNVKLREVAADIITKVSGEPPSPSAPLRPRTAR
ncbi:GAF and ANTAR domain-containing protein [Streptomyces sp. NPDC001941]|uniref:GAF and ANTAR domain-containing protein n=1 Tax=Streptomyces sp. NPDC001941 TaxID=3154659 RepID=UPI003321BA29